MLPVQRAVENSRRGDTCGCFVHRCQGLHIFHCILESSSQQLHTSHSNAVLKLSFVCEWSDLQRREATKQKRLSHAWPYDTTLSNHNHHGQGAVCDFHCRMSFGSSSAVHSVRFIGGTRLYCMNIKGQHRYLGKCKYATFWGEASTAERGVSCVGSASSTDMAACQPSL